MWTLAPSAAAAQQWQIELIAVPEGQIRGPLDPIELLVPAEVPIEVLQRLALEIDNIDMTELLGREGDIAALVPPRPLEPGIHLLRVIQYQDDGSVLELGAWDFEIRDTENLRQVSADADLMLELSQRVKDANLVDPPGSTNVLGTADFRGSVADQGWRVAGSANFLENTDRSMMLDGREFDLGEYRLDGELKGETLSAGLTLGHHDVAADNLIMSGFNRRGLSATLGTTNERFEVQAFTMANESRVGFPHITGVGLDQDEVSGVTASLRPLEALSDNLVVSGTYYAGEGRTGGYGTGDLTDELDEETVSFVPGPANPGSGWSVAVDSAWLNDRFRLRGEFAETRFDFDGGRTGYAEEEDIAYTAMASIMPVKGKQIGDSFFDWTVGTQYERIGTFFQSLPNPALVPDRDSVSLFTNVSLGGFSLDVKASRWENNVEGNTLLPTMRTRELLIDSFYSPDVELSEDGALPWYGQPRIGVNLGHVDDLQTYTPPGFVGDTVSNLVRMATVSLGSAYEQWNWDLSETVSSFEDRSDVTSDTLTYLTGFGTQYTLGDRYSGSTNVQWSHFKDLDQGSKADVYNIGLGNSVVIIPDTLDAYVDYNYSFQTSSGAASNTSTVKGHIVNGEFIWTLFNPVASKPGLALSAAASYRDQEDNSIAGLSGTTVQVFLKLKVALSLSR